MTGTQVAVPRIPALTGLRWLAACAVVAFHVGRYVPPLAALRQVTGLGYCGVGFFFVLSGFVLTWTARPGTARRQFYVNRFARVWPLHAVMTVAALLPFVARPGTQQTPATLAAVLLLVQSWWPMAAVHYSFNGVSWSLSCEAFFYALFPLFAYRVLTWRPRSIARAVAVVCGVLLAGAAAGVTLLPRDALSWALYVDPLYRLGEFVLGVLLSVAVRRGWRSPLGLRAGAAAVLVVHAALLLVCRSVTHGDLSRVPLVVTDLVMLPTFLLVVAGAATDAVRGRTSPLASNAWVRLGEWSFALYLVHELVLRGLVRVVGTSTLVAAAQTAGALALMTVLAALLHHGLEKPCDVWLRGLHRTGLRRPGAGRVRGGGSGPPRA